MPKRKQSTGAQQAPPDGHAANGHGEDTIFFTAPLQTTEASTTEQATVEQATTDDSSPSAHAPTTDDSSLEAHRPTTDDALQAQPPATEHANGNSDGKGDVASLNGNSNSNGNNNGKSPDGNGSADAAARIAVVRPVKARIGNGQMVALGLNGRLNGTGKLDGNGNGNGNGNGSRDTAPHAVLEDEDAKALVSKQDTHELPTISTTSRLRDTDLAELRLRLKTQEWPLTVPARRGSGKRALPYFMMRHRNMRSRSRVGHTRTLAAARRHGKGGPIVVVAWIMIAVFTLGFLTTAVGVGAGVGGAAVYISKLPPVDPDNLAAAINQNSISSQTTKIYDRNGTLLYDFVDEDTGRREELPLKQISPLVISATIAAEDANFYTNPGIDMVALLRAVRINLSGTGTSGASTITQQLVRGIFMTEQERTSVSLDRKIKEAVLAVEMTRDYSKDDIISLYLNQTYYGHRAYGVGAAAITYFGKQASDLTLPEAALLAGLPQSPTTYDPFVNPDDAKIRQAYVLDQMAKLDMITPDQASQAKAEQVSIRPYKVDIQAPHFVYYVKQYLENLYGPGASEAGLKVYTSLDLNVQHAAEKVAADRVAQLQQQHATNAAIVIMRPGTGEILGMVGSVNYYDTSIDGQVNVATSERQPGSSFKPITYVTAFEKGWTPATVLLDTLTAFPNPGQADYIPKNYDGKDHGWVTVREALANSLNIPAVKTLQYAGIQNTIDTAHAMGIKGLNRGLDWYGLSLTLGGGEVTLLDMTNAYSTFANQGTEVDANPILRIVDSQGRVINCNTAYACSADKQVQQTQFGSGNGQVIDPRYTYMISSILSDNQARTMEFGANSPLRTSFPSAAKTGTTNDNRDSWTLGYTPDLTVGVWVGNSNNAEMLSVTGAIGAAVIWHNMVEAFYANPSFVDLLRHPDGGLQASFVQPPGLVRSWACSAKGDINDLFLAGQVPKNCTTYKDNNKHLHSDSSGAPPTRARPTPMPGIIYPTSVP
jgi:1A family penicillin-binding protein